MTHRSSRPSTRRQGGRNRRARRALASVALLLTILAFPTRSRALCNTTLCAFSGSTCTIAGSHTIDDGCVLALTDYDVTITKPATLGTALAGDSWTLTARNLTVAGTLQAPEGTLTLQTTQALATEKTNNAPGKLHAAGGTIAVIAGGAVTLNGTLVSADGGAAGDGGTIAIAGTAISGTSAISAEGNGGDGGSIELLTSQSVALTEDILLTGEVSVDAASSTDAVSGGTIRFNAGDQLTISNDVLARGANNGPGGTILVYAGTSASMTGNWNASGVGGGSGATGGRISLDAASASIGGNWTLTGNAGAQGGDVTILARSGTFSTSAGATIDVSGGNSSGGEGGEVDIRGSGNVTLGGNVTANGGGGGSRGGRIVVSSSGTLSITKTLEARSTANDGAHNGLIRLYACAVSLTGHLKTRNPAGSGANVIRYATTFTGSGSMLADDDTGPIEGNRFECGCVDADANAVCDTPVTCASAPTTTGMTITPSPHTHPVPQPCL
jgi:hypothetical protein